jgi:hypothetical protein
MLQNGSKLPNGIKEEEKKSRMDAIERELPGKKTIR